MFEIILLTGLPGSGKTMFCKQNYEIPTETVGSGFHEYNRRVYHDYRIFHLDDYLNPVTRKIDFKKIDPLQYTDPKSVNGFIIDGFLTTVNERVNVIKFFINKVVERYKAYRRDYTYQIPLFKIQEIYWNSNREACLNNDAYRNRDKHAKHTIQFSKYERPLNSEDVAFDKDLSIILNETIIKEVKAYNTDEGIWEALKINNHEAHSRDTWNDNPDYLYSLWRESEDFAGSEFDEFDELLEQLCPNMSIFTYKKIKREADVKTEQDTRYEDYYSSTPTYYYRYAVDINKLKEIVNKYIGNGKF